MPLWLPLSDGVEPARRFSKLFNMAFRPPTDKSTEQLVEDAGLEIEGKARRTPPGAVEKFKRWLAFRR